jgi:hypothetical protein
MEVKDLRFKSPGKTSLSFQADHRDFHALNKALEAFSVISSVHQPGCPASKMKSISLIVNIHELGPVLWKSV